MRKWVSEIVGVLRVKEGDMYEGMGRKGLSHQVSAVEVDQADDLS